MDNTPPSSSTIPGQVRRLIIFVLLGVLLLAFVDLFPEVQRLRQITQIVKEETMVQALQTTSRVIDSMRSLDIIGIDGRLLEISHYLQQMGIQLSMWNTRPEKNSLQKRYPTEISLQHLLEKLHKGEELTLEKDRIPDFILEMEMIIRRELRGFHLADEEGGVKKIIPPEMLEQRLNELKSFNTEVPATLQVPTGILSPDQLAGFWWRLQGGDLVVTTAVTRSGSCLDCHPDDRSRTVYFTFTRPVEKEISRLREKVWQSIFRNMINFLLVATAIFLLRGRIVNLVASLENGRQELARQNRELVVTLTEVRASSTALKDARDRAESAIRLKDKFITVVSHDLRSPLTVIISTLEYLKGELEDVQFKGLLDHLIQRSERMLKMVQHLLEMGKLQTGVIRPKPITFNLNSTMAGLMHDFRVLVEKKGLNLENQIPQGVRVHTDFNLFNRVVENLLSNAVKFCNQGDHIICTLQENPHPVLVISDTGIGIDPEMVPFLFIREKVTTSRGTLGEEGNGLGLPLCYEIAQALGGTITVESKLGEGSSFFFHLPENSLREPGDDRVEDSEEGVLL
ncbi:MAG: HAMP domain-containing histidine kinase [Magnetococcales bacterium]|nr:HAMP domain-containing histidine kinase [Magnetococcales bacterium]